MASKLQMPLQVGKVPTLDLSLQRPQATSGRPQHANTAQAGVRTGYVAVEVAPGRGAESGTHRTSFEGQVPVLAVRMTAMDKGWTGNGVWPLASETIRNNSTPRALGCHAVSQTCSRLPLLMADVRRASLETERASNDE